MPSKKWYTAWEVERVKTRGYCGRHKCFYLGFAFGHHYVVLTAEAIPSFRVMRSQHEGWRKVKAKDLPQKIFANYVAWKLEQ